MRLVREAVDVGIVVTDLDAALAVYRDVLGLTVAARMEVPGVGELVALEAGRSRIRLIQLTDPPRHRAEPDGVRAGATGLRYLGFEVGDLDAVHGACVAAGIRTVMAPTTIGPTRVCSIADGDGNCIELLERIP